MMARMDIHSPIHFLKRSEVYDHEKPWGLHYSYSDWPLGVERGNFICDERIVTVDDLRGKEHMFTFEKHGFAVIEMESSMSYDDFNNPNTIREIYCKELSACLIDYLGATTVQIFDTQASLSLDKRFLTEEKLQIRRRHPDFPDVLQGPDLPCQPAARAHIGKRS